MPPDTYRDFAGVYDAWQMLYPRAFSLAIAPRVIAAMKEHGVPSQVLADLACGTGIFPLWWQRTHPSWTVYFTPESPRPEAPICCQPYRSPPRLQSLGEMSEGRAGITAATPGTGQ